MLRAVANTADLVMTAGLPYARRIRVTDGKDLWAALDDFEIRSDVRSGPAESTRLRADLGQFMTPSYDANDIVIDLALTGDDTRNSMESGYYDVLMSDVGLIDEAAVQVLSGQVTVKPSVSSA